MSSCSHHEACGSLEGITLGSLIFGMWMLRQMLGCQARDVPPHWGTFRGQQHHVHVLQWPRSSPIPPTAIIRIRQHHRLNQQQFDSSHLAEEAVPEKGETEARGAAMTSSGPACSLEHPRSSALQQALRLLRQRILSPYQVNSGSFPCPTKDGGCKTSLGPHTNCRAPLYISTSPRFPWGFAHLATVSRVIFISFSSRPVQPAWCSAFYSTPFLLLLDPENPVD